MSMQKVPETPLTCEVRAALEEYTQRLMKLYHERFTKEDPEAWREEYRAECKKYGYIVVSEIKEVKPKAVKYYFCLFISKGGNKASSNSCLSKENLIAYHKRMGDTIIGDIEEMEVEV